MKGELFEALQAARRDKREVVLLTFLPGGEQRLLDVRAALDAGPASDGSSTAVDPPAGLSRTLFEAALIAARRDEARVVELADADGGRCFVQPFNPPLRMILVGAVHIAQPLSRMATEAGFSVVIVDPRAAFSTEARFPGVDRLTEWPDKALERLGPDRRTAVVTLTHDPKLDDPALTVALRSEAFYVGCLGSGKTHAARLARLTRRGFDEPSLARLRGPVGLRIGARSPAEIAVSILAQIIETLRLPQRPEAG